MRRMIILASVCLGFCATAQAGPIAYNGTFGVDDDQFILTFDLTSMSTITALTTSWAQGGFAPVLTLFGAAGGVQQSVGSSASCGAGSGAVDPATGFCWDASFSALLDAGTYTLVLTQDGNLANGDTLADGFLQDGLHSYTSQDYLGAPADGPLCVNVDASVRSCNWALTFDDGIELSNGVPEPASLALFGIGALTFWEARRRRFS